jgi:hypothetical protein
MFELLVNSISELFYSEMQGVYMQQIRVNAFYMAWDKASNLLFDVEYGIVPLPEGKTLEDLRYEELRLRNLYFEEFEEEKLRVRKYKEMFRALLA